MNGQQVVARFADRLREAREIAAERQARQRREAEQFLHDAAAAIEALATSYVALMPAILETFNHQLLPLGASLRSVEREQQLMLGHSEPIVATPFQEISLQGVPEVGPDRSLLFRPDIGGVITADLADGHATVRIGTVRAEALDAAFLAGSIERFLVEVRLQTVR